MSVYTELSFEDIAAILKHYRLGELRGFEGIAAGIENSNFFIDTDAGRFVLTIFERMQAEELPYFMRLMRHLAAHGLPCPDVQPRDDGSLLFALEAGGKQGCIVSCLSGHTLDHLNNEQLESAGFALAALHLAGADFPERRENPTGDAWLADRIADVEAATARRYGSEAAELLRDELAWQQAQSLHHLPAGVIHGDLFCDNILFEGNSVSGIIDFYYAHDAPYAMDLAISINALAVDLTQPEAVNDRMQAVVDGYQKARSLSQAEQQAMPALLRRAALRFWVSRLYDAIYPRDGAMTQTKDPEEYRRKLLLHRAPG